MEIKQFMCNSCGGSLDIKPGLTQVACHYCGTIYGIEGNNSYNFEDINPAHIVISKTDGSITKQLCSLNTETAFFEYPLDGKPAMNATVLKYHNADKSFSKYFLGLLPNNKAGYEINAPSDISYRDMIAKTKFWAALAYITNQTYRIVNRYTLDITPFVDTNPIITLRDDYVTDAQINRLKRVRNIVLETRTIEGVQLDMTRDYLSMNGNFIFYDAQTEKKLSETRRYNIMHFVSKYGFETKQTTGYSLPYWENSRLWVFGYHWLTIAKDMSPQEGFAILSDEEKTNLNKLKENRIIDSIALQISEPINRGYERAIATQSFIQPYILMNSESIGLAEGTFNLKTAKQEFHFVDKGTDFQHTGSSPCLWSFNSLGMKNIDDENTRRLFVAALYCRLTKHLTVNNELRFEPTRFINSINLQHRLNYKNDCMYLELINAYYSEAQYDDWI